MPLYGTNIENSVSRNVLKPNKVIKVANTFSYNKTLSPGLSALTPGLYTSIKDRNI